MISTAMTTYNGERFLEEQLRSLTEQTTLPNELVVCDDGSTDRTPEILAQFAKRASFPVRIVIKETTARRWNAPRSTTIAHLIYSEGQN